MGNITAFFSRSLVTMVTVCFGGLLLSLEEIECFVQGPLFFCMRI